MQEVPGEISKGKRELKILYPMYTQQHSVMFDFLPQMIVFLYVTLEENNKILLAF